MYKQFLQLHSKPKMFDRTFEKTRSAMFVCSCTINITIMASGGHQSFLVCLTTRMVSGMQDIKKVGLAIGLFTCIQNEVHVQNYAHPW